MSNRSDDGAERDKMGKKTLIVGAGISGLMAGKLLHDAGWDVVVLEKSSGVGGRMATRRIRTAVFDHGAQFITARDPIFKNRVKELVQAGIVEKWGRGFSLDAADVDRQGHWRYIGKNGMTGIAKHIADGLNIQLRSNVHKVEIDKGLWNIFVEDGSQYDGENLILTAPIPQSLSILNSGGIQLPENSTDLLEKIQYDPCFALLVLLEGESKIPYPGGIQFQKGPIRWIGDNQQKGISPNATAITIHASADFSRENFNRDPAEIIQALGLAAEKWFEGEIVESQIHRWRYSQPQKSLSTSFLHVLGPPSLYFAGDAFDAARVEGAALSGMKLANHLLNDQ
jgi:predicted NAD/FAD-dependent oxidoreductase